MSVSRELDELARRVAALERSAPDSFAVYGPRSDLAGGRGVRVRFGLLSDGTYGVERFSAAGVRTVPTWV